MEKEKSKYSGRPLSEKEYEEWRRAFSDIEEAIENLEEGNGNK